MSPILWDECFLFNIPLSKRSSAHCCVVIENKFALFKAVVITQRKGILVREHLGISGCRGWVLQASPQQVVIVFHEYEAFCESVIKYKYLNNPLMKHACFFSGPPWKRTRRGIWRQSEGRRGTSGLKQGAIEKRWDNIQYLWTSDVYFKSSKLNLLW